MIKVYINYPVPHITIHHNPYCGNIQAQQKPNQRYIKINAQTLASELNKFKTKMYRFAANPDYNDMWLEINFNNVSYEQDVLMDICHLIGIYYKPLRNVIPKPHCCSS